jgi:nucleotide-binding universal stress UspA family protein
VYKRVLVPLDGSKLAEDILPLAQRLSRGFNIPLHLLTVIQQDAVAAMRVAGSDASQQAAQKAQAYLRVVSEQVSRSVGPEHVKLSVQIAKVADAIVREKVREHCGSAGQDRGSGETGHGGGQAGFIAR